MSMMFVFVPSTTERKGENYYEVRSIPGNLIGVGNTPRKALNSLIGLIDWTFEDEESPEEWYRDSWSHVDRGDEKIFGQVLTGLQRRMQHPSELQSKKAKAYYGLETCI